MRIRKACLEDIPDLIRLLGQVGQIHHALRTDIFRDHPHKYRAGDLEDLLRDPARPVFVALAEQTVVGYCFCVHKNYGDDHALMPRRELYIDDLCVDQAHRGQGIATALFGHVTGYARDTGCGQISLNVWEGNHAARAFYDRVGMTPRSTTMEVRL